jgi:hypothetical protein
MFSGKIKADGNSRCLKKEKQILYPISREDILQKQIKPR